MVPLELVRGDTATRKQRELINEHMMIRFGMIVNVIVRLSFFLNLVNWYRFLKNFSFQISKWTWQSSAAEINFGIKHTWAGLFFGCGGASNPLIKQKD
jgi:hypothetical protein